MMLQGKKASAMGWEFPAEDTEEKAVEDELRLLSREAGSALLARDALRACRVGAV